MAITPPNTSVAKSDVRVYFYDPKFHLNHEIRKGKKKLTSVANSFQLKVAKTGNLINVLLYDLIKVSSLIYRIFIYISELVFIMGESWHIQVRLNKLECR